MLRDEVPKREHEVIPLFERRELAPASCNLQATAQMNSELQAPTQSYKLQATRSKLQIAPPGRAPEAADGAAPLRAAVPRLDEHDAAVVVLDGRAGVLRVDEARLQLVTCNL